MAEVGGGEGVKTAGSPESVWHRRKIELTTPIPSDCSMINSKDTIYLTKF